MQPLLKGNTLPLVGALLTVAATSHLQISSLLLTRIINLRKFFKIIFAVFSLYLPIFTPELSVRAAGLGLRKWGCSNSNVEPAPSLATLHFPDEKVDVCVHVKLLQLLQVPCQLHQEPSKGYVHLDPHLQPAQSV